MSEPPAWMESLIDVVLESIETHTLMGPLGYRYGEDSGLWEILVYPTPVELSGGDVDGMIVSPGFSLDLEPLLAAFEQIADMRWSVYRYGLHGLDGPEISIEGVYEGNEIFLRILAEAPEDEEPGIKVDTSAVSAASAEVN
ncbi:MAG: hypothetical protein GY856_25015 [bacterium]|nr:hypothetical protein [bacterium]